MIVLNRSMQLSILYSLPAQLVKLTELDYLYPNCSLGDVEERQYNITELEVPVYVLPARIVYIYAGCLLFIPVCDENWF